MTRPKLILFLVMFLLLFLIKCGQVIKEGPKTETPKTEKKEVSDKSIITCPKCGHKKEETLPTDVCLITYTCESCKTVLHPKEGDCCVFCTYGDHKCPSKQEI